MKMLVLSVLVSLAAATAQAGTLAGKISGAKGESVVYLQAVGKAFPAPAQHAQIDQKGLMFSPHIIVVQQGTTVDFLNSDSVSHNVFWSAISGDKKLGHNMGTWPQGEKRSFKFDNPGVVPLFCNVHPDMSGYIIVSPSPYFAKSDKTGEYKIDNVPDGAYTATVWNEGTKLKTGPVTVAGDTKSDFTLSK